jgi:hypothetical protein
MEIDISTPALLFPALSLLILAFTNRFLALSQLIRSLGDQLAKSSEPVDSVAKQIENLQLRVELTKWMQFFGILAVMLCTLSMFLMFLNLLMLGKIAFGFSLISMTTSMVLTSWEIMISTKALNYQLNSFKK